MSALDRRLHAYRSDLADARLKGRVDALRYVEGQPAMVTAPVANLHSAPSVTAGMDTQLLHGDAVLVFESKDGWSWVQSERDGYVGYVADAMVGKPGPAPTHVVSVARSFVYPAPELKTPPIAAHSIGARVTVVGETETRGTRYYLLFSGGALIAKHLRPVDQHSADFVSFAEQLLHTPYLWGGASGFGIDCSGLVQLSLFMAGQRVQRDTDMQAEGIGRVIDSLEGLRRGDLVFWRGHVAIMMDEENIIHASGHGMIVEREPLSAAIRRIEPLYGAPLIYRRPD